MSRFRNIATGVVVSVNDSKDARFGADWQLADEVTAAPRRGRPPKPKTE